jgi:hypothetical protein
MGKLVRSAESMCVRNVRTITCAKSIANPACPPAPGPLTIPFNGDSLEAAGCNAGGTSKHKLCFNRAEIARSSIALSFHRVKQRSKHRSCDFGLGHPYGGQGRSRELGEVRVIEPDHRQIAGNLEESSNASRITPIAVMSFAIRTGCFTEFPKSSLNSDQFLFFSGFGTK